MPGDGVNWWFGPGDGGFGPPVPPVHFYEGSFDFISDQPNMLINHNATSKLFAASTTYAYHVAMGLNNGTGGSNADYNPDFALQSRLDEAINDPNVNICFHPGIGGAWIAQGLPRLPSYVVIDGTFTTPDVAHFDPTSAVYAVCIASAGDHVAKTGICTFYFDPV